VNTDAPWPSLEEAEQRVLRIQTKLHQWAIEAPSFRFSDLANLVADPAFLTVAWERVRRNRGARSAGVDGVRPRTIVDKAREVLLCSLREELKAQTFRPLPVRERMIPKANGKFRRLGIPTTRDRVVQATLKLVLEPIFEADFKPCSYGFRPGRRAHDAIAEIQYFATRTYEWVFEGDITACFDEIEHTMLMHRVRQRIADKRILRLVKAFLRAGILSEKGHYQDSITGTPQGGILSPVLANCALSVLDEHFAKDWEAEGAALQRARRRAKGPPSYRLIRYADDFVVMIQGTKDDAERLRSEVAAMLAPMGLRLSESKTKIASIDEGFDFLGFRIQRRRKRGTTKRYVYTYPSKKAVMAILGKVRTLTAREANHALTDLLLRVNPAVRGWCTYFRHGVSKRTFSYLDAFTWHRVDRWLRKRHVGRTVQFLIRRYYQGTRPIENGVTLFDASAVAVTRYRYRGRQIPTPWTKPGSLRKTSAA
jgi:RNA-directed DNA polymerase